MQLSIVIASYNPLAWLETALNSLGLVDGVEIIVIDNHPTQNALSIVQNFADVRYEKFLHTGASAAWNRGWQLARGHYVGYLDDDAQASSSWISDALMIIKHYQPDAFGGASLALPDAPKPPWFKDSYTTQRHTEYARFLHVGEYFLRGDNMFFRRSWLAQLGGFREDLGPKGGRMGFAAEPDLLRRLWIAAPNAKVWYDPHLTVEHRVKARHTQPIPLLKSQFALGRDDYRFQQPDPRPCAQILVHLIKLCLLTTWRLVIRGFLWRDHQQYPYWQNYAVEHTLKRVYWIGAIVTELRDCLK